MTAPRADWWKLPSLLVGGVAALGALGTVIVKSAAYISLPSRLEAAEQKNTQQDAVLTKLQAIEESNHELMKQLVVNEVADDGEIKVLDVEGVRLCCDGTECWKFSKTAHCHR